MTTVENLTQGITHLVEMEFPNSKGTLESKSLFPARISSLEVRKGCSGTKGEMELVSDEEEGDVRNLTLTCQSVRATWLHLDKSTTCTD